jgi:hypothetical protein
MRGSSCAADWLRPDQSFPVPVGIASGHLKMLQTQTLPRDEQLATYRRIREALARQIALEFRFPGRMLAVVPQHK